MAHYIIPRNVSSQMRVGRRRQSLCAAEGRRRLGKLGVALELRAELRAVQSEGAPRFEGALR